MKMKRVTMTSGSHIEYKLCLEQVYIQRSEIRITLKVELQVSLILTQIDNS